MGVYLYQSGTETGLKNAYIGRGIYEVDFTTWTHWWTASSSAGKQDSGGLYTNGNLTEVSWLAPSEIYTPWTPKKVIINYNKTGTDSWIWIRTPAWNGSWYSLPRWPVSSSQNNRFDRSNNWTITQNTISNPTWEVTWELDIDTSTTNWTITHKITGVSNITESSWVFKNIWDSLEFNLKIVNRNNSNQWLHIKNIRFEY